ncbi:Uncharacterized protein TCM_022935 [Theobroma cacao]|uniref:Uncharacterized protein n=1 Tax=Theobroma cacao TaxID=3641 RepID=A0A061ETT1_THECC|nr:Uncharacterized protein TCM_022935 [Theobroma cacao]
MSVNRDVATVVMGPMEVPGRDTLLHVLSIVLKFFYEFLFKDDSWFLKTCNMNTFMISWCTYMFSNLQNLLKDGKLFINA